MEWISVKDRLPESRKHVQFVWRWDSRLNYGYYKKSDHSWYTIRGFKIKHPEVVNFWLEILELPNYKGDKFRIDISQRINKL